MTTTHATHNFDYEEARCLNCDCRPFGHWATQHCGAAAEAETAPAGSPTFIAAGLAYLAALEAAGAR